MAKKTNLEPYAQMFRDGKPLEDICSVSGATLAEAQAFAKSLLTLDKPALALAPPVAEEAEQTGDVDTSDLHEPPVNDDRADLVSVIAVLQKQISDIREEAKRREDALYAELAQLGRNLSAQIHEVRDNAAPKALKANRGECPTVVKIVCDNVSFPGEKGGVHLFKRGDVVSVGLNTEFVVTRLWSKGPEVCQPYPPVSR